MLDTIGVQRSPEAQARGEREEEYSRLLARYRSGQISEEQWTRNLRDQDFCDWLGLLGL